MGACVGIAATAVGSCAGMCLGMCCGKAVTAGTVTNEEANKRMYLFLQVVTVIMSLFCRAYGQNWVKWVPTGIHDCHSDQHMTLCFQENLIDRVQFALSVLFVVLVMSCACGAGMAGKMTQGWFVGKFLWVPVVALIALFIPNGFFDGWSSACTLAGFVFTIAELILFVEFGICLNQELIEKGEKESQREFGSTGKKWYIVNLVISVLLFLVFLVGCIAMLVVFDDTVSRWCVGVLFVVCLTLGLLGLWDKFNRGMLPGAVFLAFMTYVIWQALLFSPLHAGKNYNSAVMWIGLLIAAFCLASVVANPELMQLSPEDQQAHDMYSAEQGGQDGEEEAPVVDLKKLVLFLLVHLAAAMYANLLLSGTPTSKHSADWFGFWVSMSAAFVCAALYGWTFIAPLILKGREF
mmetsp:Transcript_54264/g.118923  ORF Transcript_54264/g.118923 Transcript_54264/m.118923 type:complete len:407 (-) Transcript_54264:287-1507(-)